MRRARTGGDAAARIVGPNDEIEGLRGGNKRFDFLRHKPDDQQRMTRRGAKS